MFKSNKLIIILGSISLFIIIAGFAWSLLNPVSRDASNQTNSSQSQAPTIQLPDIDLTRLSKGKFGSDKYLLELTYSDVLQIPNTQLETINQKKYPFENWTNGYRAIFLLDNNQLTYIRDGGISYAGSFSFQNQEYWYLVGGEGGDTIIDISKPNFVDTFPNVLEQVREITSLTSLANQPGVLNITARVGNFRSVEEKKFQIDLTKTVQNPREGVVLNPA